MNSELTAYITLIATSSVLNLFLFFYVFFNRHKYTEIAKLFLFYTAATTIYCLGAAFGMMGTTVEQLKFWTTIQYVGMPFSPPLSLLFTMQFLGMKITKKRIIAFLIIPFITLVMVATNDWHHLHYRVFEIDLTLGAPYIHLEIGRWYVVHGIFTFSCLFAGFVLILAHWKETDKTYRPQLIALMCGQLVPMITAFVYLIGLTPPGVDPVPMVRWLATLFYLWAISSSRLFTIMPIAKDEIFNSINDGVMVLDDSNRLIEFNTACKKMFPSLNQSMFGNDLEQVWQGLSGTLIPFKLDTTELHQEIEVPSAENSKRIYQVRTSLLQNSKNQNGLLIIFTDITEVKRLQVQLEHQAYYDELTQIYNRRAFFQKSELDFATAMKESVDFTVILMDIDYFKKVNDTYGHHVGDQLLIHVAKACQTQLQEGDICARYGGEEFVFALKGRTSLEGEVFANKIRGYIEAHPLKWNEGDIPVTISMGVAEATNETGQTLYQLLNQADKALYLAKENGRNQVQVYVEHSLVRN
ncbi:histidine kinase N-terminal 7TM domain-containing protein [Robertmurraya sp. P23]|uniref:histidine kinase N-terminal 7TM domain-containing diguanylate cyclase n=1 Tax=Robertmurraya sp. P23 TaxID=3436931 RepID=UPI003D9860C0